MGQVARKSFVASVVAVSVIALALAIWHLKVLIAMLLTAFIIAAAMRPGVEWLAAHRIPRGFGVAIHYVALLTAIGLLLWLFVPRAISQVSHALTVSQSKTAVSKTHGIKHDILKFIQDRLKALPSGSKLLHPALTATKTAIEVVVGIFFTLAIGAYWIFDKPRAQRLVLGLIPRKNRKVVADTWDLIDAKLGSFVRGQLLMIVFVSTVLSFAFWLDNLPYWLLVGVAAGIVELVPVIGPLAAGALAIGVGFTQDLPTAIGAAAAILTLRMLQDYVVAPRVLGHAVGLSPLIVLVTITGVGLLLGAAYVLLAVPIAAVLATLVDVIILEKDPAKEEVPALMFPAKDAEIG